MGVWATMKLRSTRRILIIHFASLLSVGILAFSAGHGHWRISWSGLALGMVALTAACCWLLLKQLAGLGAWERRLQLLNTWDADGLALVRSSGSTTADHGWNRLVDQGRLWCALTQLERSINDRLIQSCGGNSSQVLDALPEGVAAVDGQGLITYANATLAAMCDRNSRQEMIGQPLATQLGVDDEGSAIINDAGRTGPTILDWSIQTGTSIRMLRGERRPVDTGDGQTGFVWTLRDVSQQRLAESMREEFLAAATHEFRTPLANIRAYSESLDMSDEFDAEGRKHFYNVIQSESVRLSQLVDDLLDISRMQAGGLALENRETDLARLVDEVSHKIFGQMQEKNIQYRVELPPKFPKAALDKGKLSAALVNLLGNAVKYTPDGGQVTFRVDLVADAVQFSVTDTGIGIAPEELPKVFDRFFRSNDERVRGISGSGLGLALAQEIARLHGGDITVESRLNAGTTFRLSIPIGSATFSQEMAHGSAL